MTGYVLSRTKGLPGDSGDVGNLGYLLGTVNLIVEGNFVVLAVICLRRIGRVWQPNSDDDVYEWAGSGANAAQ